MTDIHLPQALKQTFGCQCQDCGALWDGHQVPAPIDAVIRICEVNRTCWKCGSHKVRSIMPHKYEAMKAECMQGERQSG